MDKGPWGMEEQGICGNYKKKTFGAICLSLSLWNLVNIGLGT